jgi:hypothetical protein
METTTAIEKFGNVRLLAAALGISPQAVYGWGPTVPALRAYQIRDLLASLDAQPSDQREAA